MSFLQSRSHFITDPVSGNWIWMLINTSLHLSTTLIKSDSVCVHGATATAGAQMYMYYSNTTDCWGWYDHFIPKLKHTLVSKKAGLHFHYSHSV